MLAPVAAGTLCHQGSLDVLNSEMFAHTKFLNYIHGGQGRNGILRNHLRTIAMAISERKEKHVLICPHGGLRSHNGHWSLAGWP